MKFKIPYWQLALGPYILFATGFSLNALATGLNHAQMPVLAGYTPYDLIGSMDDTAHVAMTHATHLKFLCDWIMIQGLGTASPGDLFIAGFWCSYKIAAIAWLTLILKYIQDLTLVEKCVSMDVPSERPLKLCSTRKRRKT